MTQSSAILKSTQDALSHEVIQAFDSLNGPQPGFRPAHAKGILLSGTFSPASGGSGLTRAPHLHRESTPVIVRFSDFAGVPMVPDNDPNASPRGIAIRFSLAGPHVHTDIIAHSVDGFPSRTAEEFAEFLRAIHATGASSAKPSPIEAFLGSHPAALRFVEVPKPLPSSFAKESFFAVNAYRFVDQDGVSQFGRYRIYPDGGGDYLDPQVAAGKQPNFLIDEIQERISRGPVKMHIAVQLAEAGDIVDDSTLQWPDSRLLASFGTIELTKVEADNAAAQQHIIFNPIPRVDGIEPSADPLLEARAAVYLVTGRRRRAEGAASLSQAAS